MHTAMAGLAPKAVLPTMSVNAPAGNEEPRQIYPIFWGPAPSLLLIRVLHTSSVSRGRQTLPRNSTTLPTWDLMSPILWATGVEQCKIYKGYPSADQFRSCSSCSTQTSLQSRPGSEIAFANLHLPTYSTAESHILQWLLQS